MAREAKMASSGGRGQLAPEARVVPMREERSAEQWREERCADQ